VSISFLHARTHLTLEEKKNCTYYQSCSRNEEDVTYGIRAGSTRDLGFTTAFVDMIRFDYTIVDRVDCVRAGNHGYRTSRRRRRGARGGGVMPPVASMPEGSNPQGGE
jgi:hypothetical protein